VTDDGGGGLARRLPKGIAMWDFDRQLRRAVLGVAATTLALGATGVSMAAADDSGGVAAGCGTADQTVTLDLWALYGKQAPLVGDPNWGETSRTHALPSALAPGQYRVFGVSEDNLSADGQEHEQWAVVIGEARSAFMPDIPDDAIWYAQQPLPDDDGDLTTTPSWVEDELPGYDLGVVDVTEPADEITIVHVEHDGQLEPWSPNSVNYRFVALACVPPAPTTTVPPTTAAPTTVAPTTVAPTTEAPTTVAPTTAPPTTVSESAVSPEQVVAETPEEELAFTGTDVATLVTMGAAMTGTGYALLRWRRGTRRTG
jgi:hypothetical protein